MRIVLVAIGLVILLAVGWVLKGLMTDRDERDFAVHYSWIVKWALTLSRETQRAPAGATFDSPRIEVAGSANRWVVSGNVNWRDALGKPVREPYAVIVENVCKAYADARCWELRGFAMGEPAVDLAESALTGKTDLAAAEAPAPATTASAPAAPSSAPEQPQPPAQEPETAQPDDVLALLDDAPPMTADGEVPQAPDLPMSAGWPLPERKPTPPFGAEESDLALAMTGPASGEEDSLAALADAGVIATPEAEAQPELAAPDPALEIAQAGDQSAVPALAPASPTAASTPGTGADTDVALAETLPTPVPAPAPEPEPQSAPAPAPEAVAAPQPAPATPAATPPAAPAAAPAEPPAAAPAEPLAEPEIAALPLPDPEVTQPVPPSPPPAAPSAQPAPATPQAAPAAASQPPEPASRPAADPALVVLIQDRLDRAGYAPGPVDGRFGGRTQAALRAFEQDAGLPVTGQPSREALAALEQLLASRNVAPQPEPKPQVAALPPTAPPQPAAQPPAAAPSAPAVLAPQPAPPPPASAPAAPPAAAATPVRAPAEPTNLIQPTPPTVSPAGVDESLIFLIQHRLRQAGFSPGRFDGRMNEGTANAIRAYQSRNGMAVDGVPSRALLERLEADVLGGDRPQPAAPTPLGFIPCAPASAQGCSVLPS
jgi:peptidoglycan hydrolase-like protein with peptidoglycan-binding domain